MSNTYSLSEFIKTAYSLVVTKLFFHQARLVRRPIYLRGRSSLNGGKGLTTGRFCRFDLEECKKTLFIGENCEMGDMTHIVAHEKVAIGNHVLIASKCFISDTSHGSYGADEPSAPDTIPNQRKLVTAPVSIGDRVWIGENVVILSGVTIGAGCIIGANSVVTRDIPENTIAVGSPAKPIKCWSGTEKKWVRVV